ncbi:MAG: hypothetical protein K2N05_10090 [Muribaculaceae bacterium]|nr:hypothetical protein [Muribaculaceae bacterium]
MKTIHSIIKPLASLSLLGMVSLAASSTEYYYVDFEKLYAEEGETEELLTPEKLKTYINSTMGFEFVQEISYCEQDYAFKSGLAVNQNYNSSTGALFIYSNEENSKEDIGGLSFTINPQYWVNVDKINLVTFKNPNNFGSGSNIVPTEIEVALNNSEFTTFTSEKTSIKETISVPVPSKDRVVKKLSVRIPNVCSNRTFRYFVAFTKFTFVYEPASPTQITSWSFEKDSETAYLNSETPYEVQKLNVVPAEAHDLASYSSSNPEVADFENGNLVLKDEGKTTIKASVMENALFATSMDPASYELNVMKNPATVVISPETEKETVEEIYDLQGRKINGNPIPGIYIKKQGEKTSKFIIF